MKIVDCLLNRRNDFLADGKTIGKRIEDSEKQHLWEDRTGDIIDTVVFHYISAVERTESGKYNFEQIVKIFCDYGVSSHYLICRDGQIVRLVPEEKKAWHSGASIMPPPDCRKGVNEFSIGIEFVATHHSGFTEKQYISLINLCGDMQKRYCRGFNYVGHDDIAGERAVRLGIRAIPKTDPGPLFRWEWFKEALNAKK
ncbi:N-acetylmuramoyl-L-alanine amidase [Chitinispirillales bacterium ANBcel5]|uniref:N-acetylmuramoyl-L-alanine amidase n=1 Tax=Cellulosispirillum alkaliphilum TaxID=3039283 RepID=UPI002A52CDED|nr:N-acetylmuramoyl-L-alanine amidase [Chitinispirillales bacterium ANBcel5]